MGQKNSILHAIARETIKVWTNAHPQNSLPGQDLTLKIVQIEKVPKQDKQVTLLRI